MTSKDEATQRDKLIEDITEIYWDDMKHSTAPNVVTFTQKVADFIISRTVNRDHVFDELLSVCKWALACMENDNTSLKEELKRVVLKAENQSVGEK